MYGISLYHNSGNCQAKKQTDGLLYNNQGQTLFLFSRLRSAGRPGVQASAEHGLPLGDKGVVGPGSPPTPTEPQPLSIGIVVEVG